MSLSVSGTDLSQNNRSYDDAASHTAATAKAAGQAPVKSDQAQSKPDQTQSTPTQTAARLTDEQKLEQLVGEGESTQQIATTLGLTVTQVEQSLGTTSGSQTAAASLVALAGRLSIEV